VNHVYCCSCDVAVVFIVDAFIIFVDGVVVVVAVVVVDDEDKMMLNRFNSLRPDLETKLGRFILFF